MNKYCSKCGKCMTNKDGRYAVERFLPEKDIIGRVFLARGVEGIRLVDKSEVRHIHEEEV